jgi:hypothetical protein
MQLFQREKSVIINKQDGNLCSVIAKMEDRFHHIQTTVIYDYNTKFIIDATAEMKLVPFDLCHEVCNKMKELIGLEIKQGIGKWIREIAGGPRGCTHLVDLVMDSIKCVVQVTDFCMLPEDMPFDEKLQKIQSANISTCHTYSNLNRNPKYIGTKI